MRTWLLILIAILPNFCPSVSAQTSVEKTLSVANDLMNVGRISRAVKVLKQSPDIKNQEILITLLTCLIDGGYFNEAISLAEKSSDVGSKTFKSKVFTYLGTAYQLKGEIDKALNAFSEAIKLDTNFPAEVAKRELLDKINNVPEVYKKIRPPIGKEFGDNYSTLRATLNINLMQRANGLMAYEIIPDDSKTREQGIEFENKGDFKAATNVYKNAVEKGSADVGMWNSLGLCALTECTRQEKSLPYLYIADNAFAKALSIDKNDWRVLNNVALLKSSNVPEPPETYKSPTPDLDEALKFVVNCKAAFHNDRVRTGRVLSMYSTMELLRERYSKSQIKAPLPQSTTPSSPSQVPLQ